MSREIAKETVLRQRGLFGLVAFGQYAKQAEDFDGPQYWETFRSPREFLADFELYLRYDDTLGA